MLQGEHFAILSTFIKLPFVLNIFVLSTLVAVLHMFYSTSLFIQGAQWPSGSVLDSRPSGRGLERHRRHCVVVLEQDTFILA